MTTSGTAVLTTLLICIVAGLAIAFLVMQVRRRRKRMDCIDAEIARRELEDIRHNPDAMVLGAELNDRLEKMRR